MRKEVEAWQRGTQYARDTRPCRKHDGRAQAIASRFEGDLQLDRDLPISEKKLDRYGEKHGSMFED